MYKLATLDPLTNKQTTVFRLSDGAAIPMYDPDNTDYQAYLKWIALGNTPQSANT